MREAISRIIPLLILFTNNHAYENEFTHYETNSRLEIRREWKFKGNKTIHYSRRVPSDKTFIFAICDDIQFPSKIICDITVQPVGDDHNHLSSNGTCNMEFVPSDGRQFMGIEFDLQHLSLNYLEGTREPIITWNEIDMNDDQIVYKYISIIDMTVCESSTMKFKISLNHTGLPVEKTFELVMYNDTFDAVVSNSEQCPSSEWCRISFNNEGQKIGEAHTFPLDLSFLNVTLTEPFFESKEIFAYGLSQVENRSTIVAYHILPDGVIELETNITSVNSTLVPMISTANNIFLICGKDSKSSENATLIHCNQYVNGSSEPTFDFEDVVPYHVMNVHNLPDGRVFIFGLDFSDKSIFGYSVIDQKEESFKKRTYVLESNYIARNPNDNLEFIIKNEEVSVNNTTGQLCIYDAFSYPNTGVNGGHLTHDKLCLRGNFMVPDTNSEA
ncbi:hypothetical protein QAD02_018349 [Eretmocerus hayati]|uniref:Uncharacterized protein n=1 Tax=Eretmocerus hayati TaxID=131215 RepID=A0ACC2PJI5_9HYME|nr:hypothetical protein QAD02_018349 [Eretmocerus hayati]